MQDYSGTTGGSRRGRLGTLGILVTGAVALAACSSSGGSGTPATGTAGSGSGADGNQVQVAFGYPYTSVEVYKPLISGAKAEAGQVNASILESSAQLNAGAQVAELNTWIAQKVGALVVLPLDLNSLAPVVKRAHAAGTKVIGYSTEIPGADGYIKWSDAQGAQLVGSAAASWVTSHGGSAQVGLLTQQAVETGRARINGAVAALHKAAPQAKVVARAEAPDSAHAYTVTLSMLQAHPDISVIICVNDDDEVGAARAMKQLGKPAKSIWLGGFDGSLTALKDINDGTINGVTAALPLQDIGKAVTQFGADAARGSGPTSKVFDYILAKNNDPSVVEPLIKAYG